MEGSQELTDLGEPTFIVVPIRGEARHLVIALSQPLAEPNAQIYVIFDLLEQSAQGFNAACGVEEVARNDAMSPQYLTYQCSNADSEIVFVPLVDPSASFSRILPPTFNEHGYNPIWLAADELLLTRAEFDTFHYCLGLLPDWEPVCGEVPYDIMGASADGKLVETRDGPTTIYRPERLGVMRVECLRDSPPSCEPTWTQAQGVIADWPADPSLLEAGAWAADGQGLVVLKGDGPPQPRHPAEAWYLDVASGQLRHLATIPPEKLRTPTGYGLTNGFSAPFWSPNGEWLLLEEADQIWWEPTPLYLLSKETGDLRVLLEHGGGVVGEVAVP